MEQERQEGQSYKKNEQQPVGLQYLQHDGEDNHGENGVDSEMHHMIMDGNYGDYGQRNEKEEQKGILVFNNPFYIRSMHPHPLSRDVFISGGNIPGNPLCPVQIVPVEPLNLYFAAIPDNLQGRTTQKKVAPQTRAITVLPILPRIHLYLS